VQLRATISPDNATNQAVKCKSSNPKVATVTDNGLVTMKAAGTASIICTSDNNPTVQAFCNVTVLKAVTGVSLDIESKEMYVMEGPNSISVFQTGDTYTSSSAVTAGTIYVATNLKNYYKSDKVTLNTYIPTFAEKTLTASAKTSYSVTGAHKYYIGDIYEYSDTYWNTNRSETIRNFELKNWATDSTITVPYTFKEGAKQQTVVVPSVYNEVSGKDINNGPVTFNFVKEFKSFFVSQGRSVNIINYSIVNKKSLTKGTSHFVFGLYNQSIINLTH
jgi:hypothetical protein